MTKLISNFFRAPAVLLNTIIQTGNMASDGLAQAATHYQDYLDDKAEAHRAKRLEVKLSGINLKMAVTEAQERIDDFNEEFARLDVAKQKQLNQKFNATQRYLLELDDYIANGGTEKQFLKEYLKKQTGNGDLSVPLTEPKKEEDNEDPKVFA